MPLAESKRYTSSLSSPKYEAIAKGLSRQIDLVRLRTSGIDGGTGVLDHGRGLTESAILKHREDGHIAAIVVCRQDIFSRLVEKHITRSRTVRRNLIQERKLA